MEANSSNLNYKDRTRVLAVIGVLLLLVGVAVGFLGPLEMYSFYLFSAGGRFHYEGFGFGSFMFGNIAAQIVGYYLIAAMLIPLGYGHLAARRWARTLALTLLWFWLVVGAPLIVVVFFILPFWWEYHFSSLGEWQFCQDGTLGKPIRSQGPTPRARVLRQAASPCHRTAPLFVILARDMGCYSDKERTWKTKLLHLKSDRLDPAAALTRCSSSP